MGDVSGRDAAALVAVRDRFAEWMFERALPFWADVGCDGTADSPACLGAQEYLTLAGVPALPAFKRVRVQARQLFVFSWAALRGWPLAAARADSLYRFLLRAYRPDGGWARLLTREGAVLDATAELYDLAFVVFALAWYARLPGPFSGEAASLARATLGWVCRTMALPDGGFRNCLPDDGQPRQQNPHMHLFEAVLALHGTTGDEGDLAMAHGLYALFLTRFQDPATGALGEYFGPDWHPAPGEQGEWTEPGHHFEWVWLLQAYSAQSGVQTHEQAARLYRFASAHGVEPRTGLVRDGVSRKGVVLRHSARLWAQGEGLRGVLAHAAADSLPLATSMATNLLDRYLSGCPQGTWIDQLDVNARPAAQRIPTSSLYHIVTAYDALDQAARGIGG
ncbi:AGE family epimerase/isomerase [Acetobacter sp. TBRC 12305]|uniref:AGE family epimerase/isomerase n=1 Tax=Acetobacter garciniae TaxID=2817435 RepID=A0A939HLY5_9PROT|nr:AGE family epimerase/isomerase [Acetobacter garciniae]MBO1323707.1 AGE family epimerase/isomerase [Acetobacter garciniae]MBX0343396.1 AGE family epimerase/isomerase [Acetobacter garciniae]